MNRRGWIRLGGGATAALAVAVGVATNQVLNNDRLNWLWLGAALGIALLTVVVDRRRAAAERFEAVHAVRDSELELSDVTVTQTGPPEDCRAVLDLKLRNIGGQPAILHRAAFHIHDAVSLSPYYLVWFLPYRELWVRGLLQVSHTYHLALPEPEEAAGSHHNLNLSQDIAPAGTDRFHIELGVPRTGDSLVYLLHFDIHYDARRTVTSPAVAQLDTATRLVDTVRRLGACHPAALHARQDVISWLVRWDKAGAAAALAALIPDQMRLLGPDHARTLKARHYLAMCRGETGDAATAAAAFAELVADLTRVLGPDHPDTLDGRHERARWQATAGNLDCAIEAFAGLVADRARVQGRDHPRTLYARHNLAVCRGKSGDASGATATLAELVADRMRVLGPDHPDTLASQRDLAYWQAQAGP